MRDEKRPLIPHPGTRAAGVSFIPPLVVPREDMGGRKRPLHILRHRHIDPLPLAEMQRQPGRGRCVRSRLGLDGRQTHRNDRSHADQDGQDWEPGAAKGHFSILAIKYRPPSARVVTGRPPLSWTQEAAALLTNSPVTPTRLMRKPLTTTLRTIAVPNKSS